MVLVSTCNVHLFCRHYCDNSSTSEEAMRNDMQCPAGRYCLSGLKSEPDATDCSTGRYCPQGGSIKDSTETFEIKLIVSFKLNN